MKENVDMRDTITYVNGIGFIANDYISYINSNGDKIVCIFAGFASDNHIECKCHVDDFSANYPYRYSLSDTFVNTYNLNLSKKELDSVAKSTAEDVYLFESCIKRISERNYDWHKYE